MQGLKNHLYYIYLAFTRYNRGFFYLYMRYIVAPTILFYKKSLEKPIQNDNLSIHMLFGKRDFLIALWSLASFYKVSNVIGTLYIHSDGSLTEKHKKILSRLFPSSKFVDAQDILNDHKDFFEKHLTLEEFRRTYTRFQCKKLLDPFLSSNEPYRLILDSDMLWFKNPAEIEQVVVSDSRENLMMSDGDDGFAYVIFKDGSRLSDEIAAFNSGVTLYNVELFDLKKVEEYIQSIDYNNTRFTDQACYATALKSRLRMLPKETYIIKGTLTESVVMRHYTSPSRAKFFILGLDKLWHGILKR